MLTPSSPEKCSFAFWKRSPGRSRALTTQKRGPSNFSRVVPLNNRELNKHRHGKTMAWDFTHLLAKSGGSQPPPSKTPVNTALNNGLKISHICWQNLAEVSRDRAQRHAQLTSARFCQQMCEIPSPLFNAASASFLLDGGSLPPDLARGFVQSRALAFTRYVQVFVAR